MTSRQNELLSNLSNMSSRDLTSAYKAVFGKLPPKGQASKQSMIDAIVAQSAPKARIYDVPEAAQNEPEVEQTETIEQLLEQLSAAADKSEKKALRAKLRRRGYFLSKQPKAEQD